MEPNDPMGASAEGRSALSAEGPLSTADATTMYAMCMAGSHVHATEGSAAGVGCR